MSNRDTHRHDSGQQGPMCNTVQDLLPAFVTAEALGHRPHTRDPDVAAHLNQCEICRAAFNELRELMIDAYAGAVEPAPGYPQPDLSFLPVQTPQRAAEQPWRIDEWGRLIVSFSQALLDSLRPPALVGATRGHLLYSYAVRPPALPDLDVRIEVVAKHAPPGLAFVCVNVEALDREPLDQAPSQVILRSADETWEGTTDETGCVAFDGVPLAMLPHLTIEIAANPDAAP